MSDPLDIGQQALLFDHLNGSNAGPRGERVTTEGCGMHARPQMDGEFAGGQHRATSHARAEALGKGHHVGSDPKVLVAEPVARPAAAALHLVEDQQQVVPIGDFPQALQKARGRRHHPPLPEDRLDHDAAGLIVDQVLNSSEVAMRGILKTGHNRAEALVILWLGSSRDAAQCAAMEAALEGDDLVPLAVAAEPHQLDCRLVCLGAGVAEEGLASE